jgi:hypothetical protein
MAWWQPKEEESPQSRVGRARIGTTRPVEEAQGLGDHLSRPAGHMEDEPPQSVESGPFVTHGSSGYGDLPAHPPLPRRRLPFNPIVAIVAIGFVAVMVLPFVFAFNAFDSDGPSGFDLDDHDGPSLVSKDRFSKAMAKVRDEAGPEASLTALRLAPDRLDAVVAKAGGGLSTIQVLPDLHVRAFGASTGSSPRGLSLRRIDPAVPDRLLRRAAERLGLSHDDLNYMALSGVGGNATWAIFFTGGGTGRFATADLDGSNLRIPGS